MDEDQTKEPINSELVVEASPDASTDDNAQPDTTAPTKQPQKNKKPLIIILVILLLAALGAVVYLLLSQPKPDNSQTQTDTSEPEEPEEEEEAVETTIEDQATISALFEKLLVLHVPRSKSYLDYANNYVEGKQFEFRAAYTPTENIYPDASELENKDRLYIITSYLKDHDGFEPIANFNVPSDFIATTFADYCKNAASDPACSNNSASAISEEKVAETFREFFGVTPTFENPTSICGGSMYNAEYHIFHDTVGGCGGVDNLNHQLYITKYTKKGKLAYIYASLDSVYEDYDPSGTTSVYKAFLKHTDFWDYDAGQALTPDASLLHEQSLGMSEYGMYITPENYTFFEQYRFVFEKDADGNYFFKTVEKL